MFFRSPETTTRVALAALCIGLIAFVDWRVDARISFGFLYLFPVLIVGTVWRRWEVLLTAVVCTMLSDAFDPDPFSLVSLPEDILVLAALVGTGMFAFEVTRSRQLELQNLRRVEKESAARREAEEQLEFLIGSSPVAILTMTAGGTILQANMAAHRLFGLPEGQLHGRNVTRYIAALAMVSSNEEAPRAYRTEMQCRGEREQGEPFLANVFFSTYNTAVGPRLAALVVDASEELREREEASLEQLMEGSRILVGAVSHEVRNVCGAIGIIYENLVRSRTLTGDKDFEALGSLVETLHKIASLELKQSSPAAQIGGIDLMETLDDLRIVLEPSCREADIEVTWSVPQQVPPVWADRHSLLQVLLNLTKNSERALAESAVKRMDIAVTVGRSAVTIRVADTGPGIASAEKLFQPFQKGADSTGLGLYLSRAFVRSFHGELRHEPTVAGCCFAIDLAIAGPSETEFGHTTKHGTHTAVTA